jgi:hypothetical protein
MKIILIDGPHNGECHDNVQDDCLRFHRGQSFYQFTDEVIDAGRRVFKYDQAASEMRQSNLP